MRILQKLLLAGLVFSCCSCSRFAKEAPGLAYPAASDAGTSQRPGGSDNAPRHADATKPESGKVAYRNNGIGFVLQAHPQLNRYQNNSHTLFMCIYQLKDPNAFNQLAEDREGLSKLLECGRFDPSVANAKRTVLQPGQLNTEVRDRAEGARFIGIAAGYYGTGKGKVTSLAPLSASTDTVRLELGPDEIGKLSVTVK